MTSLSHSTFLRPGNLLKPDGASRLLPMIVAVMVFLAIAALSAGLTLSIAIAQWNTTLTGMLTVQVPPITGVSTAAEETEARVQRVAEALATLDGVETITVVPKTAADGLLAPWLGEGMDLDLLPLPRLIDVTLSTSSAEAVGRVTEAAQAILPDIVVDSHRVWLTRFVDLARQLEAIALAGVLFVFLATATSVSFATRSSLAVQRDVVDTLHLIGAYDAFIAGLFARHVFRSSLVGAVIGAAIGLIALMIVIRQAGAVESGLLPTVAFGPLEWIALLAVPVTAAGLAALTAFATVHRQLSHWTA